MKKFMIASISILLVVILGYLFRDSISEIPSRLANYHHTGRITVTVDGTKMDLEGTELLLLSNTGEVVDKAIISDSEFKIRKGIYGQNLFRFFVPNDDVGEILVEFGHFNTNWWHVFEYDVEVEITANHDNTVTTKINTQMTAEGNQTNFEYTKTLTPENHVISSVID